MLTKNPGLDLWTAQLVTIYTSCCTASFVEPQISSHNTPGIWSVLSCSWNWFSCWNCHWWQIFGLDCAKMDPYERWSSSPTRQIEQRYDLFLPSHTSLIFDIWLGIAVRSWRPGTSNCFSFLLWIGFAFCVR